MSSTKKGSKVIRAKNVVVKSGSISTRKRGKNPKSDNKSISSKSSKPTIKTSMAPVSVDNVMTNPTYFREIGRVKDPDSDQYGLAFEVSQPICLITTNNSDTTLFAGGLATVAGNLANLTPDALNGPLAAKATYFTKYRWRKLKVKYNNYTPTNTGNAFAMCITPAEPTAFPTSFLTTLETIPSVQCKLSLNGEISVSCEEDGITYWTLFSAASAGEYRQTTQYSLWGFPNAVLPNASWGYLVIEGVIDLFGEVSTQGFTMTRLSRRERILAESVVLNFRYRRNLRKGKKPLLIEDLKSDCISDDEDSDEETDFGSIHHKYHLLHRRNKFFDISDTQYDLIESGRFSYDRMLDYLEDPGTKLRDRDLVSDIVWPITQPVSIQNDIFNGGSNSIRSTIVGPSNLTGSAVTVHNDGSFAAVSKIVNMQVIPSSVDSSLPIRYTGKVTFNQLSVQLQDEVMERYRIPVSQRRSIISVDFDKGSYLCAESDLGKDEPVDITKIELYKLIPPCSTLGSSSSSGTT